ITVPIFTSWPEAVGSYRGQSATLTWTFDQPVSTTWSRIELLYNTPISTTLCTWYSSIPNQIFYGQGYDTDKITGDIKLGSRTVNLTIKNLQNDNVRYNYKCKVTVTLNYQITNTQGWILLKGKNINILSSSPLSLSLEYACTHRHTRRYVQTHTH
ncbi:hypothetical protein LSH36_1290g00021, partial [Paralvinella palmiformis]